MAELNNIIIEETKNEYLVGISSMQQKIVTSHVDGTPDNTKLKLITLMKESDFPTGEISPRSSNFSVLTLAEYLIDHVNKNIDNQTDFTNTLVLSDSHSSYINELQTIFSDDNDLSQLSNVMFVGNNFRQFDIRYVFLGDKALKMLSQAVHQKEPEMIDWFTKENVFNYFIKPFGYVDTINVSDDGQNPIVMSNYTQFYFDTHLETYNNEILEKSRLRVFKMFNDLIAELHEPIPESRSDLLKSRYRTVRHLKEFWGSVTDHNLARIIFDENNTFDSYIILINNDYQGNYRNRTLNIFNNFQVIFEQRHADVIGINQRTINLKGSWFSCINQEACAELFNERQVKQEMENADDDLSAMLGGIKL